MAYIDKDYYDNEFKGVPIEDEDTFSRYAERASDVIDQLTSYRLFGKDDWKEGLAPIQISMVKRATAAQVEFYVMNGGPESIDAGGDMQSVTVGSFSYSMGSRGTGGNEAAGGGRVSTAALSFLETSGLIYRGIDVI